MTPKELAEKLKELDLAIRATTSGYNMTIRFFQLADFARQNRDTILAALEAYEPWVSCRDKMPDAPGKFWVYTEYESFAIAYLRTNGWKEANKYQLTSFGEVTHWKPLSKPPEEK